jgi:prolipoprotein diacylglyceryl transferase
MAMHIPSPSVNGFHVGPLFIHYYGLMYVIGITLAILITQRRWKAVGGDPSLVGDVALWAVPAGIIGGRIYFDITTPKYIPHHWWGIFAVWSGGLGIWGGVAAGAAVGVWRVRRHGANAALFADAVAPALLVAQAIGRIGNWFNKELFGGPTSLPWGLYIPPAYRPAGYLNYTTFQPTFLYELIWDLALAGFLVWLGHHRGIRPPGLFALYVTGYSAFRVFEESLRVDPSEHFLGLRLNMYVAIVLTVFGAAWFWHAQRRGRAEPALAGAGPSGAGTEQAGAPAEATATAASEAAPAAETQGEEAGDGPDMPAEVGAARGDGEAGGGPAAEAAATDGAEHPN